MSGLAFGKVNRAPPLAEQIYDMLRQQLRSGAFQHGERLVDATLAKMLGVSRTPVREALFRLVADGLLETGDSGFQIPVPTVQAMEEIFDIRRLLERPAAERAAEAMTDKVLAELARAVELAGKAERSGDQAAFLTANYMFRAAWVSCVQNPRLRETILRFDDQSGTVRRLTLALPTARRAALELLGEGLGAFKSGDAEAAGQFAVDFIDGAAHYFHELAERPSVPHQTPGSSRVIRFGEYP